MPLATVKVTNYRALGQKMIEWAKDPASRPTTLASFKAMTSGMIDTSTSGWPAKITAVQVIQSSPEVLLIRLPSAEMVQAGIDEASTPSGKYPLPTFYEEYISLGQHTSKLEMLEYRIGDYSMGQCS